MKNKTQRIVDGLIAMLCFSMVLIGCETRFTEKTCAFCGGGIYFHQMNTNGFSTQWQQEFENKDGKDYHKWCYKLAQERAKAQ